MEKKGNNLFGFFDGQEQVRVKIEELRNEGYPSDNIYVIAKDNEQVNSLHSYSEVHFSTEQDEGWIGKFNKMFAADQSLASVFEEMGFDRVESEEYNRRIDTGEIFLFADDERDAIGETSVDPTVSNNSEGDPYEKEGPATMSRKERRKQLSGAKEDKLLLHEEQLEVHKERVQSGEVNVSKRIVEEQQHLDIPVERDDVVVERRPVMDEGKSDEEIRKEPYQVGDELHIPVVEERLVVTKKEVVTEEIIVTKRKVNDIEHVSETVKREEIEIEENDLPPDNRIR